MTSRQAIAAMTLSLYASTTLAQSAQVTMKYIEDNLARCRQIDKVEITGSKLYVHYIGHDVFIDLTHAHDDIVGTRPREVSIYCRTTYKRDSKECIKRLLFNGRDSYETGLTFTCDEKSEGLQRAITHYIAIVQAKEKENDPFAR